MQRTFAEILAIVKALKDAATTASATPTQPGWLGYADALLPVLRQYNVTVEELQAMLAELRPFLSLLR